MQRRRMVRRRFPIRIGTKKFRSNNATGDRRPATGDRQWGYGGPQCLRFSAYHCPSPVARRLSPVLCSLLALGWVGAVAATEDRVFGPAFVFVGVVGVEV